MTADLDKTASNHALWLAPLLALAGFISYWAFFARWPIFRDDPWLNLLILAASIGLSVVALRRAWPGGSWRRVAGVGGVLLSSGLTALLLTYCYVLSYGLPPGDLAAEERQPLPAIALTTHEGGQVDFGAIGSEGTVLVFYRGFW